MIERDTAQVREALAARLNDSDENAGDEAVFGLAARGDDRAIAPLLHSLDRYEGDALEEALYLLTAKTGDRRLCTHVAEYWRDAGQRGTPLDPLRNTRDEQLIAAARRCGLA